MRSRTFAFMAVGALLASFIGTTGAAMLLIRPLLETNRERKHVAHTVVFFIFIVCNCGGLLLPLGDPPLFLGYLKASTFCGRSAVAEWLFVNGLLLAIYFLLDHFIMYPREDNTRHRARRSRESIRLRFAGCGRTAAAGRRRAGGRPARFRPSRFPARIGIRGFTCAKSCNWSLVAVSLLFGSRTRFADDNNFNYGAIVEVAVLFIGIFICMQPALQILDVRGDELGVDSPHEVLLGHGHALVGARQRADVPGVLQTAQCVLRNRAAVHRLAA